MTALPNIGLLTAADLDHEPADGLRRELYDGVMHVVPPPGGDHAWEIRVCDRAVSARAPDDVYVLQNVGVHVGIRRLFVPDLTVLGRSTPFHDNGCDSGGVLLVVECVSPGSVTMDRVAKPAVYAEQGIPYFWRVDDGPRVQSYRLDPRTGKYRLDAELEPGQAGELAAPWPAHLDTTELIMPHKR